MKEIQYKTFSWNTHQKNWRIKRPNVCQFELTFNCGLHCRHCYTDCYHKPAYLNQELSTQEVRLILDKVYKAGCIWLCFTGGDPLTRKDFLDIYSYAKEKGFIITLFTNGYSMSKETTSYFKKRPPFVIEMTLNAVSQDLYERISQVKGSFKKTMLGIRLILKAALPLKIKTQITRQNLEELPRIKERIEGWGLNFRPSYDLHARLNGDLGPCNLRISPQEDLELDGNKLRADDCRKPDNPAGETAGKRRDKNQKPERSLFRCAVTGGDGVHIDPYGNMILCNLIRSYNFNLLEVDIDYAQAKLLPLARERKFTTNSKCKGCNLRELCQWCPGRAYLETKSMEKPVRYYCELAKL